MWSDREIDDFSAFGRAEKVSVFKGFQRFWNLQRRERWLRPETGALPTALHLVLMFFMRFSVSGQTCGQSENLRTFMTSGEPKKSVFSRDLGVFQNFRFEIGGLHPKLARYHLRYTSLLNSINISQINKKVNSFFKKTEQAQKRLLILFKQLFT